MRKLILLLIVGGLAYFGYSHFSGNGLFGSDVKYPFGRTLTSDDGRQLEVMILGKSGDTIYLRRISDDKEFKLDRSRLSEEDAKYVASLPDGGTEKSPASAADLHWYENYADAITAAKQQDVPVLLLYDASSW